ncbi:uncharacterized protein LOC144564390 [Carex rostrata]
MYYVASEAFELPKPLLREIFEVKDNSKTCDFHGFKGHSTAECLQLKNILERLAREGKLSEFIHPDFYKRYKWKYNGQGKDYKKKIPYRKDYTGPRPPINDAREIGRDESERPKRHDSPVINVISGGHRDSEPKKIHRRTKQYPTILNVEERVDKKRPRLDEVIFFSEKDFGDVIWPHENPIVLTLKLHIHRVKRILVDTGSSADILFLSTYKRMGYDPRKLQEKTTPLIGFTGNSLQPKGVIKLKVVFGKSPRCVEVMVDFLVVNAPSAYNSILGRGTLNKIGAVVSPSFED